MKNLPRENISSHFEAKLGSSFSDHFPLSALLPINIGGVTELFVEAKTTATLIDAAKLAVENKLPYVVIGSGTSVIVGGAGFAGLVIKNSTNNIFNVPGTSKVVCDSGANNSTIVSSMASVGLGGVEFLDSIPGTIGGAVITDAHLGDKKILSYVKEVSVFDPDTNSVIKLNEVELRDLIDRIRSNSLVHPPIVITVVLQFAKLSQDEIIRRLSIIKQNSVKPETKSLGYVFSRKLSQIKIDRDFHRQLGSLGVSYDQELDRFNLRSTCTPERLKKAISLVNTTAKSFGISESPRVTYLGYFQQEPEGEE